MCEDVRIAPLRGAVARTFAGYVSEYELFTIVPRDGSVQPYFATVSSATFFHDCMWSTDIATTLAPRLECYAVPIRPTGGAFAEGTGNGLDSVGPIPLLYSVASWATPCLGTLDGFCGGDVVCAVYFWSTGCQYSHLAPHRQHTG